ncbi:glutathione S-transferase [Ferrimonas sediminum]|uniref:Glutathione S-transferase n=1 Tax=Ferrimonas sediminum TaxID=718193 RepID=A0A1G8SSL4_9GAMM|nr:glutathione S-transferase family protein [Ferrimonas sediminum]SDJ32248.1 glutathione S-transferase [Ferrimonas sediminum]
MITLYGYPHTRSLRISWLLEELGLDWDYSLVDFNQGEHRSKAFLSINPAGKVPALTDGELTLVESGAICLHLAQKYGQGLLLPQPGSDASALHHQLMIFVLCELEQPLWTIGKHKFALPKDKRVSAVIDTACWEFDKACKLIEPYLSEQGFLLGDQFSVADILLTHTLNWARGFKLPLSERLDGYRTRISARPALASALAKESAVLKN